MPVHRGRRNRFDLIQPHGNAARAALSPVVRLNQLERSIFNLTVTRNPHLRPADAVMLTAYARAAARVLRAKSEGDAVLEKRTRTMVLLGRSLRLTAASVTCPKRAGRMARDQSEDVAALWQSAFGDDGEEPLSAAEQLRRFRAGNHLDDGDDDDG
jgi:hypothetical protein